MNDRHISNAVAELLGVPAPTLETGALSGDAFIAGKAATINGAVASKLQDIAEQAARMATAPGSKLGLCSGDEEQCARAFIAGLVPRAFHRPITEEDTAALLRVFTIGRDADASYAGGISLVIETVLQSPFFLYFGELGTADGETFRLSSYELATKIALFLRDSLPDDMLWRKAETGELATSAGLASEVDRLLAEPEVRSNLTQVFSRFFQLDLLTTLERPQVPEWPLLAAAMHVETTSLIETVLWNSSATLSELLTTRESTASPELARWYGISIETGATGSVKLPEAQRAGILTRAGVLASRASPSQTSVVLRALQIARGLLCLETPPPPAAIAAQIKASQDEVLTERARSEKRQTTAPCSGCHGSFDPFGITFEHYDNLGRYRTAIAMPTGDVPVDSSWDIHIADIQGPVADGVELSERLSKSHAARECMTRQVASYAFGQKLTAEQACTVAELSRAFEAGGGDLRKLFRAVALWPGLQLRAAATP